MSAPPHPCGSPAELPKHFQPRAKVEVMELSDLHHPNCKINRKSSAELGAGRRESESSDSLLLSPEASKATEAVEFIAEHLRNEDQYIQVSSINFYFLSAFLSCIIKLQQVLIFFYRRS